MRLAIRGLSIATGILWLFMGIFVATALYSATQLDFSISSANITGTGSVVSVSFNITIINNGFHDITGLTILSKVSLGPTPITNSSSGPFTISSRTNQTVPHAIAIDLAELVGNETLIRTLVFNDTWLNATITIMLTYAYMVEASLTANLSFPWGALMSGFTISDWRIAGSTMQVDLAFANNSPLPYQFQLEVINETGGRAGISDPTAVDAGSVYSGTISIPLQMAYMTASWRLLVHIHLGTLDLALEVMSHG